MARKVFGRNGLLRANGMSAVIASHAVQVLRSVDQILLMDSNGNIKDSGNYEQLARRHPSFVQRQASEFSEHSPNPDLLDQGQEFETSLGEYQTQNQIRVDDLRRQKGDWRSYAFYLGAMGWLNFLLFVLGAVSFVVFTAILGVWLVWWAEDTDGTHGLGYWLGLYATWAVLIILGMLFTPV